MLVSEQTGSAPYQHQRHLWCEGVAPTSPSLISSLSSHLSILSIGPQPSALSSTRSNRVSPNEVTTGSVYSSFVRFQRDVTTFPLTGHPEPNEISTYFLSIEMKLFFLHY